MKNLLDQLDNLVNSREQEAYDLVQSRSEVLSTLWKAGKDNKKALVEEASQSG